MSPWMWVLTVLGAIFGILLLLALHLVFGKLRLVADYRKGDLKIWIQWLFFKYHLYPDPEKKQAREEKRTERKKNREEKHPSVSLTQEKPKETVPQTGKQKKKKGVKSAAKREIKKAVQAVPLKDYAKCLQIIVTKFISKFHIQSLVLHASIGGEDAMDIAVEYGTVNALLYPVLGAVSAAGHLHKCDIQITPDFTSEETHAEGRGIFTFRLFRAFGCIWELSNNLYE